MDEELPAAPERGLGRLHAELRRLARKPLAGVGLAGLLWVVLFPRVGPKELTVVTLPPTAKCGRELTLSLYQGEALARRQTVALDGATELETVLSVPRGEYRLEGVLGCGPERAPIGPDARAVAVQLEEARALELDLSDLCPCLKR